MAAVPAASAAAVPAAATSVPAAAAAAPPPLSVTVCLPLLSLCPRCRHRARHAPAVPAALPATPAAILAAFVPAVATVLAAATVESFSSDQMNESHFIHYCIAFSHSS